MNISARILLSLPLVVFAISPVQARSHGARHHHMNRSVLRRQQHWAGWPEREAPLYIYRSPYPCTSLDDCDRKDYDESGTRGRLGLGASPYHPEGPGNPR